MFWIAVLVMLTVSVAAFVCGYRASARHLKNAPPYRLSDQAENFPDAAGLIGLLLPRPLKSIWAGVCIAASIVIVGALCFFAVAGSDYGSLSGVALKIGAVALWSGMMFGFGSGCERIVRSRKLSASSPTC